MIRAFQVMIALLLCGLLQAYDGYSQVLDKKVTVHLTDVSFEQALQELGSAAEVKFAYSLDQLGVKDKVSISVRDVPLQAVLDTLLTAFGIRYRVHNGESVISLKKQHSPHNGTDLNTGALKDDRAKITLPISGTIKDIDHQPMAGVNIIAKGTNQGTTSDVDGRYSIAVEANRVIVFSFIGYAPVEILCNGPVIIDIIMKEDASRLDEVVVNAGYYKTTKDLQTGNITRIEARDIEKNPVFNPLGTLQGRVAGLEVTQQSGIPGSNYKVRVRGTNSLTSGNEPLYIINGVPYTSASMSFSETAGGILGNNEGSTGSSPLNSINPLDIESIEVLKDADATSIYGSRGANGVILITTKKGKAGKANIDVSYYSGVAKLGRTMDLLNTAQYLDMRHEAFANDGVVPTPYNAADLVVWDQEQNVDWQRKLIGGSGTITDARLSVSGGSQHTQFLTSGGLHREGTVFPGRGHDQRFTLLNSIVNQALGERLVTTVSLNISRDVTDMISKDLTPRALSLPPHAPPLYDAFGHLNWQGWTASMENPLANLKRRYESKTNNVIGNLTMSYDILRHLIVKMNMGFTTIDANAVTVNPLSSYHPDQTGNVNQTAFGKNHFENWIVEPQLSWSTRAGKGAFEILGGATFLDQKTDGIARYAEGFKSEALMKDAAAAPVIITSTIFNRQYRYQAFFGRVNYTLRKKYIFNLTGRRDGSSRFGPGNRFAVFGALGSAWIFSREDFIAGALPFLSYGKLKVSYGTTGNDQIGDYQYVQSYARTGFYQDQQGLGPT
ncbi:MAG TPA: SusC/RagA family TonB-linked outer membrane protein, partial [Ohtaekwangia sp.]|nr:SusC/RagA family TonB-linked outer membrane protein [Ohtaekwangia sp.]